MPSLGEINRSYTNLNRYGTVKPPTQKRVLQRCAYRREPAAEATTFKATVRVLSGDSPLVLVKTSGSSHGGEHSSAVKMEASNEMKPTK